MNALVRALSRLSVKPEYGSDQYKEWISQADFISFLHKLPKADEMILYASLPYAFIHGVLVPERLLTPPDVNDLHNWNCNPFSSWGITIRRSPKRICYSPPLDYAGSKTLSKGEQLVFARTFEGRQEQPRYIEIAQKLTHVFGLHYVPERQAFCRFNDEGDVEDVVTVSTVQNPEERDGRIVTIMRDTLEEYIAISGQALVLMFDSTRCDLGRFGGWGEARVEYRQEPPEIYYRIGSISDSSYLRGFQIIRPSVTKKDMLKRHDGSEVKKGEYASFVAHDWKNGVIRECSCDPAQLGNYFVPSDLPFETSPAFFRPEVLQKYKADSDKYELGDRWITCRNAWHLETYDVNEAGQVHTYLIYLSYLPHREQLYWKSFNEEPKGPISKRAIQTDFKGEWDTGYDPLRSLQQALLDLKDKKADWWTLRSADLIGKVHYPVTKAADEWAKEIHALHKLLVEGFEVKQLRACAAAVGREVDAEWKSLKLIEEILLGLSVDEDSIRGLLEPLKELNFLRSKISGHSSGEETKKIKANVLKKNGSYKVQFHRLCASCDGAIRQLRRVLDSSPSDRPGT